MSGGILGVGIDIVELQRLETIHARHGERFIRKFCREGEWDRRRSGNALVQHLGGLFAAKEAVLKGLGTGWAQGLTCRQIEVIKSPRGEPQVRLHGEALHRAARNGIGRIHLSITHERSYAAAVAVMERLPGIGLSIESEQEDDPNDAE